MNPPTPTERLRLFAELARALAKHALLTGGTQLRLETRFEAGKLETELLQPEEHLLRPLLLELRPFLLDKDDAHLTSIHNLAIGHIDDPELVHLIESAKHAYKRIRRSLGLQLNIDGAELTPEAAALLYLNGVYFHHDAEKREQLASYVGPTTLFVRYHFLDFMHELAKLAYWTGIQLDRADEGGAIKDEVVPQATAHPHQPDLSERPPTSGEPLTVLAGATAVRS